MKVLVTGGWFDDEGDAVVWLVDFSAGTAEVWLNWLPPKNLRVARRGFAGGDLNASASELYVAAHAAVVRISVDKAAVTGVMHQPCMNDLHHVTVAKERLLVANTGLSAVEVFGVDGQFVGSHSMLPAWLNHRRLAGGLRSEFDVDLVPGWDRQAESNVRAETVLGPDRDPYFSTDRTSRPFHQCHLPDYLHINHVAAVGHRWFATCFADGSLRDVLTGHVVRQFPGKYLHDGNLHGDSFWLTSIDGFLLELDATDLVERRRIDVFSQGHHGWCRGLAVTDCYLVVGLTEVRPSSMPRHHWSSYSVASSETSVLLLERSTGKLLQRVNLSNGVRHSKLYSVLPVPENGAGGVC